MSTHKHFNIICYAVLAVTLIITVLFMNGEALGISVMANEDDSSEMFTENDLNADWDTSEAAEIVLSDDGSTVSGNGAYIYNNNIYIAYAGQYILSGTLSDGSIIINADSDDKIWLMLDGVSINCNDNSAIRIEQADKVFITLADETENTLSSGSQYSEDAVSSGIDATLYSRDDLTINGSGSLNVKAEYQHGIVCNDDLVITGGTITADAVQDAIHANDSVRIKDADITISAGDDGITVSNDDETAYLYIDSGTINILSCYEGLEAIDITIAGGDIDIISTDDGINANGSGDKSVLRITDGDITIKNSDGKDADGLDSNKDIYISGGNLFISVSDNGNSAIDYRSENGGECEISGGTVLACGSSSMAEGFDSSSEQGFIMYSTSAQAETTVTLEDEEGNELISAEIPYAFSSVVVSTPEMSIGDTCIVTVGDSKEEITIDNTAVPSVFGQGGMRGGMKGETDGEMDSKTNGGMDGETDGGIKGRGTKGLDGEKSFNSSSDGESSLTISTAAVSESEDSQSEIPSDIPAAPETDQESDADTSQPDFSQGKGGFENQPDGEMPDISDNDIADFSQTDSSENDENNTLSKENLIYLAVSFGVLITGCIIAFVFKKRK